MKIQCYEKPKINIRQDDSVGIKTCHMKSSSIAAMS